MGIRHWIEKDRRRVRAELTGNSSLEEMLGTITGAVEDPDFEPGFDVLSDHSGVGQPLTTPQAHELSRVLERLSRHWAGTRWAVVTTKPASIGMIRMLAVLSERVPMTIRTFRACARPSSGWPGRASPRRSEAVTGICPS